MRLVAKVKAGCEVLAAQARRAGRPVAATKGDVATPAEHGAFFRGGAELSDLHVCCCIYLTASIGSEHLVNLPWLIT